uniref:Uncharacterized protein n=1 Tax=viral metagenome TaxID=1070528 RepID=A0A6C0AH85_9ZZZZ
MKEIIEIVALNKALQSRFRKENEFIADAKRIVRGILDTKFKGPGLSVNDIRDIDNELQKIIGLINTNKPLPTDANLTDMVNDLVKNPQQLPKPAENKQDQTQQRSDKPKHDPFAHLLNKTEKTYDIPDEDGNSKPVAGQGEKGKHGIKMLTDKQVDDLEIHHLKRGGRKSRRIHRKKF